MASEDKHWVSYLIRVDCRSLQVLTRNIGLQGGY